jgi:hypothetical protein
MKNQLNIRKTIISSLVALIIGFSTLMPLTASATDAQGGPQEGIRGVRGPHVTCTTSSYNIIIAIIVVTQCSDGSSSTTIITN